MAQCVAKSKRSGERCGVAAVRGELRCYHHLGKSFALVKADRDAAALAGRLLASKGNPQPVENPLEQLALLAGELIAFKDATSALVGDLKELRYKGKSGEQLRAELGLYERAQDRCGRMLVDIARLNIDSRLAAISEAQAQQLEVILIATLATFGISGRDSEVRQVVAQQLAALPAARVVKP